MKTNLHHLLTLGAAMLVAISLAACADDNELPRDEAEPVPMNTSMELADSWIELFPPSLNSWHWDSAILMLGMVELSQATGEARFLDYARAWMDYHIAEGYYITSSDTSIPGRVALKLYQETGEAKYRQVADEVWDYIANKAVRTDSGGLNHAGNLTDKELWVDTLFMVGPFLLEYSELTGDAAPRNEFMKQLRIFRTELRDTTTGMYFHRYDEVEDSVTPTEPFFWARGNSWVFVASNFGLLEAPEAMAEPDMFDVASDMRTMNDYVSQFVTSSGVLHTIVNRSDSYLETSAGMLWAYGLGLGMEAGTFGEDAWPMLERLVNGGLSNVVETAAGEWLFLGVSYGTSPGEFEYYQEVLKGENVAYGLGAFMLASVQAEKVRPAGTAASWTLATDGSLTEQEYLIKPEPCSGVECVQYYIGRGHFTNAVAEAERLLAENPNDAAAGYYLGLIKMVRVLTTYIVLQDAVPVGALEQDEVMDWLRNTATPLLESAVADIENAAADPGFVTYLDRLLIFESGGHTCIGAREYDQGDALLIQGLCYVMAGGLPLLAEMDSNASVQTLTQLANGTATVPYLDGELTDADYLVMGLDKIEQALIVIYAETDDQSDDFIPNNLFQGTGTFRIPGILPPTPSKEILLQLDLEEEAIDNGEAPDLILGFVQLLKQIVPSLL